MHHMACIVAAVPMFCPIQVFCPYAYGLPHMHMGSPSRTGSPYAYGIPVRVWAAHMRTGSPYTHMGQNSYFAHMRMSAHMRISILDHIQV